jgi:uncharacterized protein YjaZ
MSNKALEEHLNESMKIVEATLQGFQKDLISWETKVTQMWNVLNAIIRVFEKQGLLSEELLKQAGKELYDEYVKNLELTRLSVREGHAPQGLIKTPMEQLVASANSGVKKVSGN